MKTLHLTVTRHWFDKIASGEKKEDFRTIKGFWVRRLMKWTLCRMGKGGADAVKVEIKGGFIPHRVEFRRYSHIKITAGYGRDKPTLTARCTGIRITADDEQTDLGTGRFFAIGIGEILEKENL